MIDFITNKLEIYTRKGIDSFWSLKRKLKEEGIILDKSSLLKRIKLWKELMK